MKNNMYTLKCKDISVCDIEINNGEIVNIIHTYNKEYAPVETFIFGYIDINRLNQWLNDRAIPLERDGYNEIVEELDIKNSKDYLIDNLALSLSDQYWLKPRYLDLSWEDVNFFCRDYNIIEFSNATFGQNNSIHSSFQSIHVSDYKFRTPNASLGGMLKKIWVQKNQINYLIEGSHTLYKKHSINIKISSS